MQEFKSLDKGLKCIFIAMFIFAIQFILLMFLAEPYQGGFFVQLIAVMLFFYGMYLQITKKEK